MFTPYLCPDFMKSEAFYFPFSFIVVISEAFLYTCASLFYHRHMLFNGKKLSMTVKLMKWVFFISSIEGAFYFAVYSDELRLYSILSGFGLITNMPHIKWVVRSGFVWELMNRSNSVLVGSWNLKWNKVAKYTFTRFIFFT